MLPLTFVSGLNFPALAHAAGQARAGIGRPVSRVLFANTAGTICGAVVGGLYLLPAAGLHGTFLLGITATALVALVVLARDRGVPRRRVQLLSAVSLAVLAAYAVIGPGWDLRLLVAGEFRRHEGIEAGTFAEYRAGLEQQLLFYRDGISATVSVERQPPDEVTLRVNGKADASAKGDRDTELLSGHLPAILHPTARRALVIGYGSGITVGALLRHPIESVDVVEISPEVIAADEQFRPYNHDPLHDPRTHLYVEDARTFLYRVEEQYDLIVSEPSNPWIAGIATLFTVEFFDQVRSRLAPDGVLVQWFHTYETSDTLVRLILRTVAQGFGEVRVFQPNRWDVFVVAAPSRRIVSRTAMEAAFREAGELGEVGINRVATVLGLEMLADAAVRRQAGAGVVNRDRLPVLEYMAPRAFFDGKNASLIAKGAIEDGFVQPAIGLDADDYRDLTAYLKRADLLHYNQALRIVAAWLAAAPQDQTAAKMLTDWTTSNPNSPVLLETLSGAASHTDPATRDAYAGLLMRVVWSLHLKPAARDVAAVAPIVRTAAQGSEQAVELLTQLGELYVASGAYADAIETLDAALAQSASAGLDGASEPSALHCARGRAFEKLGNVPAAQAALALCRPAAPDAAHPFAESRRLDQAVP